MSDIKFKVLFNNNIPRDMWHKFLSENTYSTPFQAPEFYDLFNAVRYLSAEAIAVFISDSIKALAVVTLQTEPGIKSFFSRRAIIYGGPLISEDNQEATIILMKEISEKFRKKVIYIESRNLFDYSHLKKVYSTLGWNYKKHLNFRVYCESEELVWSNLNRLRKREKKKATANNVIMKEADCIDEVKQLYDILHKMYYYRIKKPIFNWEFFQHLFTNKLCKVFLVKYEERVVAGHFCPLNENVIYDWYGCGLDKEFKDLAPSTMAVYSALRYGYLNGYRYLDFMGAGSPDKKYGVRQFKEQFGGELVEYGKFVKIFRPFLFKIGISGLKLILLIRK
jgi:hypothetical protein